MSPSMKRPCPVCGRKVAAGPHTPTRRGAVETTRWTLVPHPPRRGAWGLVCEGSGAVIDGERRPRAEAVQGTLLDVQIPPPTWVPRGAVSLVGSGEYFGEAA